MDNRYSSGEIFLNLILCIKNGEISLSEVAFLTCKTEYIVFEDKKNNICSMKNEII